MNQINTTTLHTSKFLALIREGRWEYVDRVNATGAALIAAVTAEKKLLLVEQYRIPVHSRTIELPAGIIGDEPGSADESHAEAARRELLEETGYDAGHIEPLTTGPACSGITSERVTLFRATGLRRTGKGGGVAHEDITVHEVPLAEIVPWLEVKAKTGVLVDPKVYAGLFFGRGTAAQHWIELGWGILCDEISKQVFADGPDFEGSTAYHRLVQELFLLPALYRRIQGMDVPRAYESRLIAMARFTAAYSRSDGSTPLLGDADDARMLPFGGQDINDHRYLAGLVGAAFDDDDLVATFAGSRAEVFWLLGENASSKIDIVPSSTVLRRSVEFANPGYFMMRNEQDHVFATCAQLGLGGRGGHSHNDTLSFEAVLLATHLVSDCGSYVYTPDYAERNRFRSTAYHNTPQIDGEEINRLIGPNYLWGLRNDAVPDVREVDLSTERDRIVISHSGFARLAQPVTPVRTLTLWHAEHRLTIEDEFEGSGAHRVEIPLHLATGVSVERTSTGLILKRSSKSFLVSWDPSFSWTLSIEPGRISPSYGIWKPSKVLRWRREGKLTPLRVELAPL